MRLTPITGAYFRVADPEWVEPLDPGHAAESPGQRWNPPGLACLYVNRDEITSRANVRRNFHGLPYGPEDLDPATAPLLLEVELPEGRAVDAFTARGLRELGLPDSYPTDRDGGLIEHRRCQPLGQEAFDSGTDGVDARSAAEGGTRELAWFPRDRGALETGRRHFDEWW